MLKYVASVLLLAIAVASNDRIIFPDEEISAKSWGGYNQNNYDDIIITDNDDNSNSYGNRQFGHEHNHRPEYSGNYYGNNGNCAPGFGNNPGYNNNRRPSYSGIVSQSDANAQSTGTNSFANAQSNSQSSDGYSQSNAQAQANSHSSDGYSQSNAQAQANSHSSDGYSQSNAQANSQNYHPNPSYPYGSSDDSGASSAASATSGIVNGYPVASASAAAASSGSGSSSSSSSASSAAGFVNGPGKFSPWLFRSRISDDTSDANSTDVSSSTAANDDKIVFSTD